MRRLYTEGESSNVELAGICGAFGSAVFGRISERDSDIILSGNVSTTIEQHKATSLCALSYCDCDNAGSFSSRLVHDVEQKKKCCAVNGDRRESTSQVNLVSLVVSLSRWFQGVFAHVIRN